MVLNHYEVHIPIATSPLQWLRTEIQGYSGASEHWGRHFLSSLWRISTIEKGPQGVSFIERLSSLCRLKCISIIDKGPLKVCSYREIYIVCSVICILVVS